MMGCMLSFPARLPARTAALVALATLAAVLPAAAVATAAGAETGQTSATSSATVSGGHLLDNAPARLSAPVLAARPDGGWVFKGHNVQWSTP